MQAEAADTRDLWRGRLFRNPPFRSILKYMGRNLTWPRAHFFFVSILAGISGIACTTPPVAGKEAPLPVAAPTTPAPSDPAPTSETAPTVPAYLGILYVNTPAGVMVLEVVAGSPASRAGIRPYDVIVSANGFPVIGPFTLRERILSLKPYTEVDIEIRNRDGMTYLRHAVLEPLPERYRQGNRGETF